MRAEDVTDTLELALEASGCASVHVLHKPRLLSDNGPSYVAGELADYLADKNMKHVRGAPFHPQTQGKIERWHQTRLPHSAISAASSRTARKPEIDVSGTARRHSRVTSSTMFSTRNRRPVTSWSCTKSRLQHWFGNASPGGRARVPTARLRPLRRRTVKPSSR
jgi:transposase InsO family protein